MSLLTEDEREQLGPHGLAVFRDRLILDAQPPIRIADIEEIEALLEGKLPRELVDLWSVAFGGWLNYELTTSLEGYRLNASFSELFYPGSAHCQDLQGWIYEELELLRHRAEDQDEDPPEVLARLPIGGFDEFERVYVDIADERPGRVLLWARRLDDEMTSGQSTAEIADGVADLFDQLYLEHDPFAIAPTAGPSPASRAVGPSAAVPGQAMVEAIRRVRSADPKLAAKLTDLVRSSIFQWRAVVDAKAFTGADEQTKAGIMALLRVATHDDMPLLETLLAHRYPTDLIVQGAHSALTLALASGSLQAGKHLLDAGVPLGHAPVRKINRACAHLIDRCIDADLPFDVEAPLSLAEAGKVDAAVRLAKSAIRHGDWRGLLAEAAARATRAAQQAQESKGLASIPMDDYATKAQALRRFIHGVRQDD